MAEKLDFKKEYKDIYLPKREPVLIQMPGIRYLMVDGEGAPESTDYQEALQLLYTLSFTIKMSKMGGHQPENYVDYVVPPLEGLWDCGAGGFDPNRNRWKWTSLLRQPDFVTQDVFEWACVSARKKKPDLKLERVRLQDYEEGLCVQMMHVGPYTTEQETIDRIAAFIAENGLTDECGGERRHHEVYLSDPRRTAPEKLKTVIRHPVAGK